MADKIDLTPNAAELQVIAPNFKRRLSGVTATVVRLVPLQAEEIAIATACPVTLKGVPQIPLWSLLQRPRGRRVWHARRNVEMIGGLILKHLLRQDLGLLFTSASQRPHSWLSRWLIARMDRVVATSSKSAQYLQRDADVILHGIDTESFQPAQDIAAVRARLGLPPQGPIIGCFGRIRHQKGTDIFVDTALALLDKHPDLTAVVMGRATAKDTEFERQLRARVTEAGAQERILFAPEVPVWEMPDWYSALDLYVAPQRWEGFGLTPLEAMSCGVPVVATKVGAFEDLIDAGRTGTLVARDDLAAMTRAVDEILGLPARRQEWSGEARKQALTRFDISQEATALVQTYRQILGQY